MKKFFLYLLLAITVLVALVIASTPKPVRVRRADGALTPLRVYTPRTAGCAPLALISPGAGGTEDGYRYLARGLQRDGWLAIVIGHKESGPGAVIRDARKSGGLVNGIRTLVLDASAYKARFMDIDAALQWANASCKAPFVVLLGHSMGARTIEVEAGARNNLGLPNLDRFDAYVALSPDGPGPMFPENAWTGVQKPFLMLTGTRDASLDGDWKSRTTPYDSMPAGCKWVGVIDGATHPNFAGLGFSGKTERLALLETKAFLDGLLSRKCAAPVPADGITLRNK